MELNEIVGGILMGIGIAFVLVGLYIWILFQRIRGRVDDMVKQIIQEAEADLVGLDIELDNGTYFCYDHMDKQFVCQGATVAEIKQAFQKRFPTKTAYLAGGDPAVVATFRTELLRLSLDKTSPNV
jgi:hypothetical protein